jgi:lipopolysaccharide/colanic/teichoic acid biosynthesis glycosyltransferase
MPPKLKIRWETWRPETVSARIHSIADLHWALYRERARSDRSERPFSLLVFELRESGGDPAQGFQTLLRILESRLRCYDEMGYLDRVRLGVILPETPASGAWKVADDVLAAYPTDREPPHCEVFLYPSDWQSQEEEELPANEIWPAGDRRPVRQLESLFVRSLPRWKRALDVLGATVALILFAPLFASVALAVKLSSPGQVLFRQWRTGEGNRRFLLYKFRTMYVDAELQKPSLLKQNEQDGPAFKMKRDPRVTRIGRFLRQTSLDELPQLWNVLKGEMSLVGPRPLPCQESDASLRWQRRRLDVTPGLTCIWQVRGRSRVSFDEWMRMDVRYSTSRSFVTDLRLLCETVWVVLARKGAY